MTERIRRTDLGHLEIAVTFDDPKAYNKAWTFQLSARFAADTEMIEAVCNERPDNGQRTYCAAADDGRDTRMARCWTFGRRTSGRSTDDPNRAVTEHLRDVRDWPRQPINGVLEHPGNAVVVFGRGEQQTVASYHARLRSRTACGKPAAASRSPSYSGMPWRRAICNYALPSSNGAPALNSAVLYEPLPRLPDIPRILVILTLRSPVRIYNPAITRHSPLIAPAAMP